MARPLPKAIPRSSTTVHVTARPDHHEPRNSFHEMKIIAGAHPSNPSPSLAATPHPPAETRREIPEKISYRRKSAPEHPSGTRTDRPRRKPEEIPPSDFPIPL
jgi:hypothetical protein